MEQHTLLSAGQPENVTSLVAGEALDVTKHDYLLLNWRQFRDCCRKRPTQLAQLLRAVRGRKGRRPDRPMPRPFMAFRSEPRRVDRGLAGNLGLANDGLAGDGLTGDGPGFAGARV